jgi:hypothetical protein
MNSFLVTVPEAGTALPMHPAGSGVVVATRPQ